MTIALKLTQIEDSIGIILPDAVVSRLKLRAGDTVWLTETPNGASLAPADPAVNEQLELGREFMSENVETFQRLAK